MKIDNLVWYSATRDELPDIAFGMGDFRGRESLLTPISDFSSAPARVAFSRNDIDSFGYRPPALFILGQKNAAETLSWLRVFAKQAFPLSQFARVITDSDWDTCFSKPGEGLSTRTDKWASVILGEILAQGDSEIELEKVPLSRASGCFSAAIARATYIHDSFTITRACADRLRLIADDQRFFKRAVTIDALVPIWTVVSANLEDSVDSHELVELVLQAAGVTEQNPSNVALSRSFLNANPKLFSDSVEERVVAFQRLANEAIGIVPKNGKASATTGASLALGAFLVGRGTSHAFLLRKVSSIAPTSFAWFGLVAALSGSRGWDPVWSRLTKGIERQIRMAFSMQDPPAADVCWTEYNWLSQSFSGPQGVSDLARLFPRTLSIEVIPGVVCQFRLSAESQSQREDRRPEFDPRESEIRQTLEQLASLSAKARVLLDSMAPRVPAVQQQPSLGFDERNSPSKPRSKRTYKRSDK